MTNLIFDGWVTGTVEELAFRGYLLIALVHYGWTLRAAIGWNAVLFVLPHLIIGQGLWWMPIIPLFLSTLLFCYLYLATHSIWAAVSFHTVANIVFGLVNRGLLVEAAGMDENLMTLVWVQGMVYLVPIVLLHNRIFRVERMAAEV